VLRRALLYGAVSFAVGTVVTLILLIIGSSIRPVSAEDAGLAFLGGSVGGFLTGFLFSIAEQLFGLK
jgi:uncharacterized membrane protein YdcZ (DUF606 family)